MVPELWLLVDGIAPGPLTCEWCPEQPLKECTNLALFAHSSPKAACHTSLYVTPRFDKYSQDENTLYGI